MILTLCGSMKFEPMFKVLNEALSLMGHCVFTVSVYPSDKDGTKEWYTEEEKHLLDDVHKAKIEKSNGIVLINAFAYIGESTMSELNYARHWGKEIFVLESWGKGLGLDEHHYESVIQQAEKFGVPRFFKSPTDTSRYRGVYDTMLAGPAGPARNRYVERIRKIYDLKESN